jgi:hypothetical protein
MAFKKTGLGITPAEQVEPPPPQRGEERGGRVWDGEKWVTPEDWATSCEDP